MTRSWWILLGAGMLAVSLMAMGCAPAEESSPQPAMEESAAMEEAGGMMGEEAGEAMEEGEGMMEEEAGEAMEGEETE